MIAPATMPWTIGIQFINQTWNALFNYGNATKKSPQTNADIGVPSSRVFDSEVEKNSYMWREGGQFSTKKYNPANS